MYASYSRIEKFISQLDDFKGHSTKGFIDMQANYRVYSHNRLILITTSLPLIGATEITKDNENPTSNFVIGPYVGCYIEASGVISHFDFATPD